MTQIKEKAANDKSVEFLYGNPLGRILLHFILAIRVPKLLGALLRCPLSRFYISSFVKKNHIDMSEFQGVKFKSFNDFFTRKKPFNFDPDTNHFISPADSLLSIYSISSDSKFHIKGFDYSLSDFFDAEKFSLSSRDFFDSFNEGLCLVFRLCASDYHRYCFVDNGRQNGNHYIEGSLYSVQPLAAENFRLYTKNRRSWTLIDSENFGRLAQIEVGAFSVGGIKNHYEDAQVKKGDEKGYFDLHGSTIVILVEKDKIKILPEILKATEGGKEYRVKIGEFIAEKF